MKDIKDVLKPYMLRPTLQKAIVRLLIGLIAALLWDRTVNSSHYYAIVPDTFFVVGAFWLTLAWINYLRLDGLRNPFANSLMRKEEKKKKRLLKRKREMIDYVDEELSEQEQLTDREKLYANFFANVVSGLLFFLPALFVVLI